MNQVSQDIYDYKRNLKIKEGEWVNIISYHGDVVIVEKKNLERVSVQKKYIK